MSQNEVSISLLKRPIFLSTLPVAQFKQIDRKYLFAELARLDRLLEQYPTLIASQSDMAMAQSLRHCKNVCVDRYTSLRQLVSNWQD